MLELRIKVEEDILRMIKDFDRLRLEQVPFAASLALTNTAKAAQGRVRSEVRKRFTLRNTWVEKGIIVQAASKANPVAMVGSRDWFMVQQETGGTRRAKQHRMSIPKGVRKSERQRITRSKRPAALLRKRRFFVNRLAQGQAKGSWAVLRRVGDDRYPLQVLYLFKRQTKLQPRFGFFKTVQKAYEREFPGNFRRAMRKAMLSRRR